MRSFVKQMSLLGPVFAVLLAACGGGGGASQSAATSPAPSSKAAASSASGAASSKPAASQPAASKSAGNIQLVAAYAQASSVQAGLYYAAETGLFAKNGLNVTLKQIGGTAQVPALVSNEIQVAALGGNEVVHADLGGASIVMIATCSDFPIFSLYTDKKYKTVNDLAGQTIGVTSPGSATDATAHLILKHYGMLNKVKIQPSGGTIPAILAAMTKGFIAGGIVSPPTTQKAASAGFFEMVNGVKMGVPMNHSGVAVTKAYLKDHADVVKKFLSAYQEAWTQLADPAHKADALKALEKYTKSDEQLAQVGYDAMGPVWTGTKVPRVNPEGIANVLALSDDPKAKAAKPEQFIDNSIIDSLAGTKS